MIIYPAIDIRAGRVVRLRQGDPAHQTIYADDPVEVACRCRDEGAQWLHVVNLDGAFSGAAPGMEVLTRLAMLGLPVQFGGGLRSLDDAQRALEAGASRVVLGTLAVEQPEQAGEAVSRFGKEAVAVALDARDGLVATRGWQARSAWRPADLGQRLAVLGVRHVLYTDISRDGELGGVNVEATAALARETGLAVIASGGIASLDDIRALKAASALTSGQGCIAGAVIGQALYTGAIALPEAIRLASGRLHGSIQEGEEV